MKKCNLINAFDTATTPSFGQRNHETLSDFCLNIGCGVVWGEVLIYGKTLRFRGGLKSPQLWMMAWLEWGWVLSQSLILAADRGGPAGVSTQGSSSQPWLCGSAHRFASRHPQSSTVRRSICCCFGKKQLLTFSKSSRRSIIPQRLWSSVVYILFHPGSMEKSWRV